MSYAFVAYGGGALINLRSLQLFVATAERLSMSKAAVAMNISQPALSRQIKHLENHLGVSLLHRSGQGLSLTAEGEQLLPHMGDLIAQAQALMTRANQSHTDNTGFLRLGATPQTIEAVLAPVVNKILKVHKGIEINIFEGRNSQLLESVDAGAVHCAIAWAPTEQQLDRWDLFRARLYAVLPPDYTKNDNEACELKDIVSWPILSLKRGYMTRSMLDGAIYYAGLRAHRVIESGNTQTIRALARSGMGVGIVSSTATSGWDNDVIKPITVDGKCIEETVSAVTNRHNHQPAVLSIFYEALSEFLLSDPAGHKFREYITCLV